MNLLQTIVLLLVAVPLWSQSWEMRADMPNPRHSGGCAVLGGKVYLFGGWSQEGELLRSVEQYDPASDTWTTKADMLTPRAYTAVAVHDGLIYVFGGGVTPSPSENQLDIVEVYDPVADAWAGLGPMPQATMAGTVEAVGGRFYLIEGFFNGFTGVWEYDPQTDGWTERASMPAPRLAHTSGVIGDRIFTAGGSTGGDNRSVATWEYDRSSDIWTRKANMPTPRAGLGGVVVDDKLYAIGGINSDGLTAAVERYSPASDTWASMPPLNVPRNAAAIAIVDGVILAMGGAMGTTIGSLNDLPGVIASVEALRLEAPTAVEGASWGEVKADLRR